MPQQSHMGQIFPDLKIALNCWEGVSRRSWFFSAVQLLHLQVWDLQVRSLLGLVGLHSSSTDTTHTPIAPTQHKFSTRRSSDVFFPEENFSHWYVRRVWRADSSPMVLVLHRLWKRRQVFQNSAPRVPCLMSERKQSGSSQELVMSWNQKWPLREFYRT